MKRSIHLLTLLLVSIALSACGKVAEKATEKLAEKAIESNDGVKAKVDLSNGAGKVTTTDASGKTASLEWGGSKVSEAELGVPFYSGANPVEGGTSTVVTSEATVMTVALHSNDLAEKVTSFYREKLKAQSQGKQFLEMSLGEGGSSLTLGDNQAKNTVQVNVTKTDSGSDINIVVSHNTPKS